jgi:hypothetical protein
MIRSNRVENNKKFDKRSKLILATIIILLSVAVLAMIALIVIANK